MIVEVSEKSLLKKFSDNYKNTIFLKLLEKADAKKEKNTNTDYFSSFLHFFYKEKKKSRIHFSLYDFFLQKNQDIKKLNNVNNSDEEMEKIIRIKMESSIYNTCNILKYRIDKFGLSTPNIQRIHNFNRILIELSGTKDIQKYFTKKG
jgi:SecD/SecF fusion protein